MTRALTKGQKLRNQRSKAGGRPREADVTLAPVLVAPDPPGEPTPERIAKGEYTVGAGVRVFRDAAATPLRRVYAAALRERSGRITLRMVEAGEKYEDLRRAVWGSPGSRSCLDWAPRGGSEDRTDSEVAAREALEAAEAAVRRAMAGRPLMDWAGVLDELRGVCVLHHAAPRIGTRRRLLLEAGLRALADHWRMPEEE